MNKNKWIGNQPVNLNNLAGAINPKVLLILVRNFLCNVNNMRALIGLCLLVMSHLNQIRDPWDSQVFTIAYIVIGLSLNIHSFIHLRYNVDLSPQGDSVSLYITPEESQYRIVSFSGVSPFPTDGFSVCVFER